MSIQLADPRRDARQGTRCADGSRSFDGDGLLSVYQTEVQAEDAMKTVTVCRSRYD